ncbi:phosphatidylserine decarboxylase family protein [Maridesulfovibrio sp.]|uniref:phosphatidylserine decarboxylase family protein n=1 Tax=Maridesulfovibrio sp. TaxID=2795000 RepID=UPI0029CAA282|nr:phosphatidylserine decarboxylase family protein [Maridesulfovibrio sp.]
MKSPSIGISLEGYPSIGLTGLSAIIFAILDWQTLAIISLLLCWFSVGFFRNPERVIPQEKDIAVSPADGKIIRMTKRLDPMTGHERECISIFMNIFQVHVNRAPVQGKIESIKYWPGKYLNASLDKASTDNERCGYLITDENKDIWSMVQIAGLIARRIVCYTTEGDTVSRGQRYGLIRFGSCVELYLPPSYTPTVKIGDYVTGGQDIIARARK